MLSIEFFYKLEEILASEALLRENKNFSNKIFPSVSKGIPTPSVSGSVRGSIRKVQLECTLQNRGNDFQGSQLINL